MREAHAFGLVQCGRLFNWNQKVTIMIACHSGRLRTSSITCLENVQIVCFVYAFLASGWHAGREGKKSWEYDECLVAWRKWVVCICQCSYYSRQQSYRPISCTIITTISSSRSPYSSSQLCTSQPWQPKHVLTQTAPALGGFAYKRSVLLFKSKFAQMRKKPLTSSVPWSRGFRSSRFVCNLSHWMQPETIIILQSTLRFCHAHVFSSKGIFLQIFVVLCNTVFAKVHIWPPLSP